MVSCTGAVLDRKDPRKQLARPEPGLLACGRRKVLCSTDGNVLKIYQELPWKADLFTAYSVQCPL